MSVTLPMTVTLTMSVTLTMTVTVPVPSNCYVVTSLRDSGAGCQLPLHASLGMDESSLQCSAVE